jgi:hypothetical protein
MGKWVKLKNANFSSDSLFRTIHSHYNESFNQGGLMANDKESDLVEAALNEAIKGLDGHDDGDLLIEWVLVAFVANAEEEKGSGYPMLFSNGDIPLYRARGLLMTGLSKLEE